MKDPARIHECVTVFDRLLSPVHRWIWRDAERRVQKLFRFGELDDLQVDEEADHSMLALLHLSEKPAASRFTVYRHVMQHGPVLWENIQYEQRYWREQYEQH